MLDVKLLNSDAELNNFKEIETVNYVPGEVFDVAFRVFLDQLGIRYILPATATVSADILNSDGTTLTKTATNIDSGDRSMWKISLSNTETENIAGNNIEITVDVLGDGTDLKKGIIKFALSKQLLSGDC